MNAKDFFKEIYPKTLFFKIAYWNLIKPPRPVTLTFSVTNLCQSRCKTCKIWAIYGKRYRRVEEELKIEEIQRIFKSIRRIYFFNVSGGEPFLRNDLVEIITLALEYLHPKIIHIPTNALSPKRVVNQTQAILNQMKKKGCNAPLTIKPSLDGIGKLHDEIRGIKGNWEKLLETLEGLKFLEKDYHNLHIEIGTVISNFNKEYLQEIEEYVLSMGIQSYRNEIAEEREEFLNMGDPISPSPEEYTKLMIGFSEKIRSNLKNKRSLTRMTECLRLVYYELASEIIAKKIQVIPCYAGISNVHLTPYGDLWPCCVLGYKKSMGNMREEGYNFWKVWHSPKAEAVRRSIKNKECACPLANQAYSNILCHTPSLLKVLRNIIKYNIF